MENEKKQAIIDRAQAAGSTATTYPGALRYLRSHTGLPHAGLLLMSDRHHLLLHGRSGEYTEANKFNRNHAAAQEYRYGRRAERIYAANRDRYPAYTPADLRTRLERFATRSRGRACAMAESYHSSIKSCYTSARAKFFYGSGSSENVDWHAYSKSYGHPARWRDPGVEITGNTINIYTARDKKISLPLPRPWPLVHTAHLLPGDYFAISRTRHGIRYDERYTLKRGRYVLTGYTIMLQARDARGKRQSYDSTVHARTIAEHSSAKTLAAALADCRAQVAQKEATWQAEYDRHVAEAAYAARAKRRDHVAGIVARLCGRLAVTRDAAKLCGYCDAGVQAFAEKNGFNGDYSRPLAELRATGDTRVQQPIMQAARAVADLLVVAHS